MGFDILSFFGGLIADSLAGGIKACIVETVYPWTKEWLKARPGIKHVCAPEDIPQLLATKAIKTGDYVEGTGFFSLYTASHQPRFPLDIDMNFVMDSFLHATQTGGVQGMPNPVHTILPTTQFPIKHPDYRVAFLYPHKMPGFGIPWMTDGTTNTIPFLGRQTCIVPLEVADKLANRVVKYHARVIAIRKDDIDRFTGHLPDDQYENMRKHGLLTFLSAVEPHTGIEDFEASAFPFLMGSHFVETHWEQPEVIHNDEFGPTLNRAIEGILAQHGLPAPRHSMRGGKDLPTPMHCWALPGLTVMQPAALPYFHFQVKTNLLDEEQARKDRHTFEAIKNGIVETINTHFGLKTPQDINSTHDYGGASPNTILQSTAARTIKDPLLNGVRGWLERKRPLDN